MENNYTNEHVINLVPMELFIKPKPDIYQSVHAPDVKNQEKENRYNCKTMGKLKTTPPNPKKPVMKGTGDKRRKILGDSRKSDSLISHLKPKKPPVPNAKELAVSFKKKFAKKSDKANDKIYQNAMQNINSVAKKGKNIYVDSCDGHKNEMKNSGLVPKYVYKAEYGVTPNYILQRKIEVADAEAQYDDFLKIHMKKQAAKEVGADERRCLLENFKTKWNHLNHKYQGLSVVTDTVAKKSRKEKLENEISQIEADIKFLEKYSKILIR